MTVAVPGGRSAPFLSVVNLTVAPPGRPALVENTSFQIGRGEFVVLIGPSGSGKTSIVNLLCGLLGSTPEGSGWRITGTLACGGRRIDLARELSDLCGLVFQGNALFDDLSASENIRIAADHAPRRDPALADAVIALLPDIDPRASIGSCSGGQRQRIAIARTLLSERPILMLDEPNSGLDIKASRRLAGLVKAICRESGKPAVIVAHHVEDLLPLADRVLLLDPRRRVIRQIPPEMAVVEAEMLAMEMPAGELGAGDGASSWRRRLGPRSQFVWFARYFAEYFWVLCLSPFMLAYIGLGGVILGFVSIWFGFNYHSFGGYLKSILHDETLAGLGFVQTTVAVPLICAILVMARNSAIIAADLSNRMLSSQFKAMDNLRIPVRTYIVLSIVLNNLVALALLTVVALIANSWASLQTWLLFFPEQPIEFWRENYFRRLVESGPHLWVEFGWILAKVVLAALVGSAAAIAIGFRRKTSVISINNAIAEAIVVGVSVTLLAHAAIAVMQFWA